MPREIIAVGATLLIAVVGGTLGRFGALDTKVNTLANEVYAGYPSRAEMSEANERIYQALERIEYKLDQHIIAHDTYGKAR